MLLSIQVSALAVLLGSAVGIPAGAALALFSFPGRRALAVAVFTLMGLPPVLIGVVVYLLLSRYGALGFLDLLFTPWAMTIAQTLLVAPIVTGLTMSAVQARESGYRETALSLGATRLQLALTMVKEARRGIAAAVAAAFGRAISEVGAVMLVGGNIEHQTRVMTTAIILETRKGNYETGLQLGLALLALSFLFNSFMVAGALERLQAERKASR
ncbi:ABC transporter permease [Paenibacillus sp.]|uniref:ABC transporter permease n=1 Tax=Paenibacillus sp. TaxID=58172 RepID=UPI002D603413|nr:ABC transporter permease [Paenibacillus sp.]HZG86847.1 ABC transporter permease [Paenibacillus sp.]